MKIREVDFGENPIMLAPMAGVTDVGFRAVCSSFGADATVTEMLSARAMQHNPKKTEFLTLSTDFEKIKTRSRAGRTVLPEQSWNGTFYQGEAKTAFRRTAAACGTCPYSGERSPYADAGRAGAGGGASRLHHLRERGDVQAAS